MSAVFECPACKDRPHYQDQVYGPGMRAMNYTPKNKGWRCTVCGHIIKKQKSTEHLYYIFFEGESNEQNHAVSRL